MGDEKMIETENTETEELETSEETHSELSILQQELSKTQQTLKETEAKWREISRAYTHLQNDMDAFRKRMTQQSQTQAQQKGYEVVAAFFEPIQNLKRCVETPNSNISSLLEGLHMVLSQFSQKMEGMGLQEVPGVGSLFNPLYHNALVLMPVSDPAQDGRVQVVHQVGYSIGETVLQEAQVVVGKYEAPASETAGNGPTLSEKNPKEE